jgi:hypothetical protein
VERTIAVFRIGRQLQTGSECAIDLLVVCAISDMGCSLVDELSTQSLSDEQKAALLAAIALPDFGDAWKPVVNDLKITAASIRKGSKGLDEAADLKNKTPEEREASAKAIEELAGDLQRIWDGDHPDIRLMQAASKLPALAQGCLFDLRKTRVTVREISRKLEVAKKRLE